MEVDAQRELHARLDIALRESPEAHETLVMAAAALEVHGQCRVTTPFAELRPVLTEGGMKWCCTHNPEHCSAVLGAPE